MFFHPMDFLIFIAFGIALYAQSKVSKNFNEWSKVPSSSRLTGYEVAKRILEMNGLSDVEIERVRGKLTDHYDPVKRVVRLSDKVYDGNSIASISVAAHETGHAIQHKEAYGALVLRHKIFPLANFTSKASLFLLLIGFMLQSSSLIGLGIVFFSVVVAFQIVTLPVEFNASSRAKKLMIQYGFIQNIEERGVNKVLNAAALTYVASALIAILELIKYIAIFTNNE